VNDRKTIAIIGTGNVGASLARRLAGAGFKLRFGVRPSKDISALLDELRGEGASVSVAPPDQVADGAELVFLAIPAPAAVETVASLGELRDTVVVDCSNPITWAGGPVWNPPSEGSIAAAIAAAHPEVRVVKAFNGFGAEFHANPEIPGVQSGVTVFMASDDADAKRRVASVAEAAGFSPVDAGPLRNAAVLENAAVLWIHLATAGGLGRGIALQLLRR